MEDPEPEWEIQEYSSKLEVDENTGIVKWMLKKGFVIGKKMVIAGIAISSAPLVVPPLMVFSAMGVAFSVPFGLYFASYACTNKLMRTLLPTPPSPAPLMLEYYYTPDEYQQEEYDGSDDYRQMQVIETEDDYGQKVESLITNVDEKGYYTNEKDNERMEDIEPGIDDVFELGDYDNQYVGVSITNGHDNLDEKGFYSLENEYRKEQIDYYNEEGEDLITQVDKVNVYEDSYYTNENVVEKEMEENVSEEDEREKMEEDKLGVTEFGVGVDDHGYEGDVGEYLEGDNGFLEEERKGEKKPLVDINTNTNEVTTDEKEEILKGSTGLLENMRDEGIDNGVEHDYSLGEGASDVVFDEVKDFKATEPITVKEISSQKLVKDESKNGETVGEMKHVVILASGNQENNFNSRELEELDLVASEVVGDANKETRKTESDEKVMRESMGTQEKTSGNTSNDRGEDSILRTKKEGLIHSNTDAREIGDESGLDLFDERNMDINLKSLKAGVGAKEITSDENVDVMALPTFKLAPFATDNVKVASQAKTNMKPRSREDVIDDENIWEKIEAMRTIVGYNAPSEATCIGELKALYVFTGVEPPASFKGDSDLDEVNANLKFLMSIVGVK